MLLRSRTEQTQFLVVRLGHLITALLPPSSQLSSSHILSHMSSSLTFPASDPADVTAMVAHLKEILALPLQMGVPPTIVSTHHKPRKPKPNNTIAPSVLHPHVLAHHRVRLWSTPHSTSFHSSMLKLLPLENVIQLLDMMLVSIEIKTRKNYGFGLLRFHQYCDSRRVPEKLCKPASDHLLASFVVSWAGKVASTTVQNWFAWLHFWHNLHGAPWNGHTLVCLATSGLSKLVPSLSKRPHHPPVTLEHMHALFCFLDLSNMFDVSIFAVAATAFWSCCRLGELIVNSSISFNSSWCER